MAQEATTDKTFPRRYFRMKRRSLSPGQRAAADKAISEHLRSLPVFRDAATILCYVSIPRDEVDTRNLLTERLKYNRLILVPRTLPTGGLSWHRFEGFERLVAGCHGILEPSPDSAAFTNWSSPAVVLVPGVAFTPEGDRLGQGAGYYDRFLPAFSGVSIGLAYSCQLARSLPRLPHDRVVDYVITEDAVYTTSS